MCIHIYIYVYAHMCIYLDLHIQTLDITIYIYIHTLFSGMTYITVYLLCDGSPNASWMRASQDVLLQAVM